MARDEGLNSHSPLHLHGALILAAKGEGFPLAGTVDIALATEFNQHVARYDSWLSQGFSGEMNYLTRGRDRRADPTLLFPEARSVLSVAIPYSAIPAGSGNSTQGPRFARYIRGHDYHAELVERLEKALKRVEQDFPALRWKICVDTSAVLERSWAALAGLGWIGKNTLLIHPQLGSYLFLAEALLNLETGKAPNPLPNYCGNCTRCLTACPTQAFPKPGVLDSNRCVSYLTLEKRGSLEALPTGVRENSGTWIAGCDICQEVCPFNSKPARNAYERAETGTAPDPGATSLDNWILLLQETEAEYKIRVARSSLSRVKPAHFKRNLALALTHALLVKPSAEAWPELDKIEKLVQLQLENDTDPTCILEWQRCLEALQIK